ncbi:MAG TPA: M67 family metallopeptidase [Candidatus Limnocylindria bacterium]
MSAPGEIRLGAAVRGQILAHARAALPNEACGLLAGSTATGLARAFHPARNADASPYRFTLDPDDLVRITFAMERAGDELLAIVHAHPRTAAEPSPTDRRAAQLYPGTPQLIVNPSAGAAAALRAWRIGPDAVEEVAVRIGQLPASASMTSPLARSTITSRRGDPSSPPER